jgi:8-oxo-dGTP pyrophosphatase MutT (NUDIX family)
MGTFSEQIRIVRHDLKTLRERCKRIRSAWLGVLVADIRQLGTREIYRNPWLRLREDQVQFADGTTGSYTVVDKPDFVVVLPESDGGFWLVQQYRYPVGSRQWEFPQGGWPSGESGTVEELAIAELAEETGLRAAKLVHLGRLFAAYGYSSQSFDVFRASGLTQGTPRREVTEQDMVHQWFAADEVRAMVVRGDLADSHSIAALMLDDLRR